MVREDAPYASVSTNINASPRAERESRLAGADLEVTSASGAKFPEETADTIAARPEVGTGCEPLAAPLLAHTRV